MKFLERSSTPGAKRNPRQGAEAQRREQEQSETLKFIGTPEEKRREQEQSAGG